MKKTINKKMTIDDLAMIITEGRKETNELASTIDDLAIMVANGFDRVDAKIDKEIGEVKREIAEVKENLVSTRRDILSMGDKFTMKFEFHELASRVSLLEQKRKVKR